VERAFFAGKGRELPRPVYRVPPEVAEAGARFRSLKALVPGDNAVEVFLRDTCDAFATAARMLAAVGTRDFYHSAVELYGRPGSLTADRKTTNLGLAEHFSPAELQLSNNETLTDTAAVMSRYLDAIVVRMYDMNFVLFEVLHETLHLGYSIAIVKTCKWILGHIIET